MSDTYAVKTEFRAADRMTAAVSRIGDKVRSMTAGVKKAVGQLNSGVDASLKRVQSWGRNVAVAGVVAGGGLALAAAPGVDFEQTLANVRAVANPTADELKGIGETALQTGADFGFAGTAVATSMESMAKQGLSASQVIEGIGGVAAAAAADGSELEDTMGGLLATMAGLGKGAGDLGHIADVMAKAGDATAASIGSLTDSMSVFGPTAKALNIPLESAVGQLAILQDAGLDASSAGTTLSAVYSKLSAPMGRTAKALKKLGLDVKDSFGNMKPPETLLNEILAATSKIKGNVGKAAAITELVGLESQKALLNVTSAVQSGKFDKVMKDLTSDVDGYAKKVAAIKMDSTRGDVNRLTASFDALRIQLFGIVSKDLRELISMFTKWVGSHKDAIASGLTGFLTGLKESLPTIALWLDRLAKFAAPFLALAVVIKAIAAAQAVWNAVAALNPYTAIILGIAAAVGLLIAFWPEISKFFKNIWTTIVSFATRIGGAVAGAFMAVFNPIKNFYVGVFHFYVGLFAKLVRFVLPYVMPLVGVFVAVGGKIKSVWSSIATFIGGIWDAIVAKLEMVGDVLAEVATIVVDKFLSVWSTVSGFFSELWGSIVSMYETYIAPIVDKVLAFAGKVGGFIGETAAEGAAVTSGEASLVTPSERVQKSISESTSTSTERSELTVRAPAGSVVRGGSKGNLGTIRLKPSGAST